MTAVETVTPDPVTVTLLGQFGTFEIRHGDRHVATFHTTRDLPAHDMLAAEIVTAVARHLTGPAAADRVAVHRVTTAPYEFRVDRFTHMWALLEPWVPNAGTLVDAIRRVFSAHWSRFVDPTVETVPA